MAKIVSKPRRWLKITAESRESNTVVFHAKLAWWWRLGACWEVLRRYRMRIVIEPKTP